LGARGWYGRADCPELDAWRAAGDHLVGQSFSCFAEGCAGGTHARLNALPMDGGARWWSVEPICRAPGATSVEIRLWKLNSTGLSSPAPLEKKGRSAAPVGIPLAAGLALACELTCLAGWPGRPALASHARPAVATLGAFARFPLTRLALSVWPRLCAAGLHRLCPLTVLCFLLPWRAGRSTALTYVRTSC